MRQLMPWQRLSPIRACRWRNTTRFWKWRRTILAFAKKFASAFVLRANSCSSRRVDGLVERGLPTKSHVAVDAELPSLWVGEAGEGETFSPASSHPLGPLP